MRIWAGVSADTKYKSMNVSTDIVIYTVLQLVAAVLIYHFSLREKSPLSKSRVDIIKSALGYKIRKSNITQSFRVISNVSHAY